ncbi:MAG: phosphotransferase family protein [Acidimicrobiales bacterium]
MNPSTSSSPDGDKPDTGSPDTGNPDSAQTLLELNGIDSAWLSGELNRSGVEGVVTGIDAKLVGTGQVGENVRCELSWATLPAAGDGLPERPDSVVIKLASSNATSRAAAEATRTYIREVGFYRDLADSVSIRVPRVHHVSEDRAANSFILVMEDIAPAAAGNQLAGSTLAQAELAVAAAADLHGSTWNRPELAELDWLDKPDEQSNAERVELFGMLHTGFVERYREMLGPEELQFGQWLAANFEEWLDSRSEPQCLVHGDFRLDNMLFGTDDPAPPLATVDWQTPSLGRALSDVAYFLSGSFDRATRQSNETALLDLYRNRLTEYGIELSPEETMREYRLAAPAGYVMAAIASQLVGQTDRGDQMFMVMASGSAAQAIDIDTVGMLS